MIDTRFYHFHGGLLLSDIARLLNLDAPTDGIDDIKITMASNLADCTDGAISFYNGKKYLDTLKSARGGVVLCRPDDAQLVLEAGCVPVGTQNPRVDFSSILSMLYSKIEFEASDGHISSSATVSESARIMPGAVIGANAVINANTMIGPNTVIGPGVTIGSDSTIGACVQVFCADIGHHCTIHGGAVIGGDGFGVAQNESGNVDIVHVGNVLIGDNVTIGSNTAIDRGMLGATRIGARTKIDNLCQIGHNTQIGDDCIIAAHAGISGSCIIGNGAMFGGAVGIADHIKIGAGAVLSGKAGVMKNVPDGEVWSGYPAKPLKAHMREVATLSRLARPKK